jgi:hypothetical protein
LAASFIFLNSAAIVAWGLAALIGDNRSCPMPRYTMRLCWQDRPDDYSLLVDGKPAGRCYLMRAADNREVCAGPCTASQLAGWRTRLVERSTDSKKLTRRLRNMHRHRCPFLARSYQMPMSALRSLSGVKRK